MRCEEERVDSDVMMIVVFSSSILDLVCFVFSLLIPLLLFDQSLLIYMYQVIGNLVVVIIKYCEFFIREKTKGCGTKEIIVGFACFGFGLLID